MSLLSLDQIKTLYDDLRGRIEDGGSVINFLPVDNASGSIASFPDGADNIPVKSLIAQITPVQSGTGDPAPDNIRPISGWTGAKINVTGINLWDEEWEFGGIYSSNGLPYSSSTLARSKNYIPVTSGATYYAKSLQSIYFRFYDKDKNYLGQFDASGNKANALNSTFTIPDKCYYFRFVCDTAIADNSISLNYPSTDISYHAYNGSTVNVDWTDEAGTVYGGTLTYIGGGKYSLQATHDTLNMGTWGSVGGGDGVFVFTGVPTKLGTIGVMSDVKADCYKPVNATYYGAVSTRDDFSVMQSTTNASELYVKDTRFTSIADFKAANVGKLLYYPLRTLPDPIILDAEDVKTLLGDNNIFVDTGDVSVDYRADIALYIQKVVNA